MKIMKKALLLICFLTSIMSLKSQSYYSENWQKVENLDRERKPKSALAIVTSISLQATADKNDEQIVKSLLYASKYILETEENAHVKVIKSIENHLETSEFPTTNILNHHLGTILWDYVRQRTWQIYDRTYTNDKVVLKDFEEWDIKTFEKEIHKYYSNSLLNNEGLKNTSLNKYTAILSETNEEDKDIYNNTSLYELIQGNALEFYKSGGLNVTNPVQEFNASSPDYFVDTETFLKQKLPPTKFFSSELETLKAYQSLLSYHQEKLNVKKYMTLDIERLEFLNQKYSNSDKNKLFKNALKKNIENYHEFDLHAVYLLKLSEIMAQEASETNDELKWQKKKAISMLSEYIKTHQNATEINDEIRKKINEFKTTSISVDAEKFWIPNQLNKVYLEYTNLSEVYLHVMKLTREEELKIQEIKRDYTRNERDFLSELVKNQGIKTEKITVKNEGDFLSHSIEIPVPALDNGIYCIAVSEKENEQRFLSYQIIHSTKIAVSHTNNTSDYFLIHRKTGHPLKNLDVEANYLIYNNYKDKKSKKSTHKSDKNGKFSIPKATNLRAITFKINSEKGVSYFDMGSSYSSKYNTGNRNGFKSFIFTDRAIYRPGQIVYFKSILTKQADDNTSVVANKKATITLKNVNGEKVQELNLETNEYGSLSGNFVIPKTGLNGNYNLSIAFNTIQYVNGGYHSVKVEEYKRPKFFTEFLPVKGNYKLNDSIKVTGRAESYAGSNLTDAKVKYSITRNERRYYPWYECWRMPYYSSNDGYVVTNGETDLNKDGKFEIDFLSAVEKGKSDVENLIYTYTITADVTDINGETRSSSTSVEVGNISLNLTISTPYSIERKEKKGSFYVNSTNLNGQFIASDVEMKIYKLKAPSNVFRPKPLNTPDYQYWNEKEYNELFPYEDYKDSRDIQSWEKAEEVFTHSFNTKDTTQIEVNLNDKWKLGNYIAVVTGKDKSGIKIENASYFKLTDLEATTPLDNQLFEAYLDKSSYEKGESGMLSLKTSAEKLKVLVQLEKYGKIISEEWITVKKGCENIDFKVDFKDEGQFALHYSFVYENSSFRETSEIHVNEPNRNLSIETITFRDRIRPGENETWKFKVSGPNSEKVTAEFLASMYDKSLDEFTSNYRWMNSYNRLYIPILYTHESETFGTIRFDVKYPRRDYEEYCRWRNSLTFTRNINFNYYDLNFGGFHSNASYRNRNYSMGSSPEYLEDAVEESEAFDSADDEIRPSKSRKTLSKSSVKKETAASPAPKDSKEKNITNETSDKPVKVRKNLQETAFFYPHLETDSEGNLVFSFNSPEAMTSWKLQLLGHTKDARPVAYEAITKTQKELFVTPNSPRFLRQGDTIMFKSKITNLSNKSLSGNCELVLFDAVKNEEISTKLIQGNKTTSFKIDALGNSVTEWELIIPDDLQAVRYRVIAKAGDFSDGEENYVPVLTNRTLVTETMPIWVRGNEKKIFTLNKLKNNRSNSIKQHRLTLEMTSNPAWYAVQSLPYLMEYPHECAEQTFARYYANALGTHIVNSNPKIKQVFDQWKSSDALISNLEKNQELKSIIIAETPWLRDAESETEQHKRIALLFDLNTISMNLNSALKKLNTKQNRNGSWSWFKGGKPNRHITQHIMQGFGHLKSLGVKTPNNAPQRKNESLNYLQKEFISDYNWTKNHASCLECNHLSSVQLQYLYLTTLWNKTPKEDSNEATNYYLKQIDSHWTSLSLYNQGLSALILTHYNESNTATKILSSIKERAVTSEELGAYWKENVNTWNWYESNIETQSLLIEVFAKLTDDNSFVDEMKIWLLKNKQTNRWKTTKATTEAVYALLLKGTDWLADSSPAQVKLGGKTLAPKTSQAGTGYFKESWTGKEITKEMAVVEVNNPKSSVAWGGMYWQYFEDLDKITSSKTPLSLEKSLYLKTNTAEGEKLKSISNGTQVKIGDLVKIRIVLKTDRDMQFIHMKDMRSSGLEPTNVISRYKWQDGLGYYQETKDVSTNFFFSYLPKGTYVFEYDLRANNSGKFSNGITTVQSMYAPEFSSHSEGMRLKIE